MLILLRRLTLAILSLMLSFGAMAQTPVANRIKAVIKHLPAGAQVVAKYTDNRRHCVYYTLRNRLFCYDVMTTHAVETFFSTDSYAHITATWLSPDGNFFFITVDKGNLAQFYLNDGKVLWRFDSRTQRAKKIGQGFDISHKPNGIIIKSAARCINPEAPQDRQHWTAQDHQYDNYGKNLNLGDEYQIN